MMQEKNWFRNTNYLQPYQRDAPKRIQNNCMDKKTSWEEFRNDIDRIVHEMISGENDNTI
jgi:hypothetical protein